MSAQKGLSDLRSKIPLEKINVHGRLGKRTNRQMRSDKNLFRDGWGPALLFLLLGLLSLLLLLLREVAVESFGAPGTGVDGDEHLLCPDFRNLF